MTPTYSFVIPIYGDGDLAEACCEALRLEMRTFLGKDDIDGDIEVIFVNDGSPNQSQVVLEATARKYLFVRVVELSRNFGQHVAISCGFQFARGQYIGMFDVDMQDPPQELAKLIRPLQADQCDIAIGLRSSVNHPLMDRLTSRVFHLFLRWLTGSKAPIQASTMRVFNRRFLDSFNSLQEKTPFIPGLQNWLGFRHAYIPIEHRQREAGRSTYTFRRRLRLATDSIISFSDLPLRLAGMVGSALAALGLLLAVALLVQRLLRADVLPGFTSIIVVVIVMGGTNLMFLGLIGLYLGRVLREVQGRPRFVVKSITPLPGA
jgi:dolichol-phosphate mannosyltransferase